MPKVSIIMTVFNTAPYLKEAIDSILNQTYGDFEFIIVNDGSTDSSEEIILSYADKRIVYLKNERNIGLVGSLNLGLGLAKGEYILRMDSDDVSIRNRIEIQLEFIENNEDCFLVAGSFIYVNSEGVPLSKDIAEMTNTQITSSFPYHNPIHHPTVMFRNLGNIHYREKAHLCEDRDLWFRLYQKGYHFHRLSNIVLEYRIHSSSVSMSKQRLQKAFISKVNEWYFERHKTGSDSYDVFDKDAFINSIKTSDSNDLHTANSKEIKFIFKEHDDMIYVRKLIFKFWKDYGFFVWLPSFLYLLITYMPKFVINLFRKAVWS